MKRFGMKAAIGTAGVIVALAAPPASAQTPARDVQGAAAEVRQEVDDGHPVGSDEGHAESPGLIGGASEGVVPAITTLIVFALLMAVLGKYAWGPIATGLKQREDKIRQDIADAERARADAQRAQAEYQAQLAGAEERVRVMIAKAQQDGNDLAGRIRAQAQQEADEAKDRATREIEAARRQAVADVRGQAATLSVAIAEKILRRNLTDQDQTELVRAGLDEMDAVGTNGNGRR